MHELTITELKLKYAQLNNRAARLRAQQPTVPTTSPKALCLARDARQTQERANDYRALIVSLNSMEGDDAF